MKIKLSREEFLDAVQWASRAVQQRPANPILGFIKIVAEGDQVEFSSYDYEVSASTKIAGQVLEAGETLVSGRMIADIAKALPQSDVVISKEGDRVFVTAGRARFDLLTMSIDDYPDMPNFPQARGNIDGKELAHAISQVSIATSKDDTLPLLTGVRVEVSGDNITFLATDRYRLAQRDLKWEPEEGEYSTELLVKARILSDVGRYLAGGGPVEFSVADPGVSERGGIVGFKAGQRQATSSLMDGDYPPVRKLFPEDAPLEYVFDRQELLEAVKRVSLVVERKTQVRLQFSDSTLVLEAGQGEGASAQESIPLVSSSEDLKTAFNPAFLQDGLAALETKYVRFSFTDGTKAAVMVGQQEEDGQPDESFRYLLMPIRYGA